MILQTVRELFRRDWEARRAVRLLGVHVGSLQQEEGQLGLLGRRGKAKWSSALRAADALRDRFGEASVGLASAMRHGRKERVHENPGALPGKRKRSEAES